MDYERTVNEASRNLFGTPDRSVIINKVGRTLGDALAPQPSALDRERDRKPSRAEIGNRVTPATSTADMLHRTSQFMYFEHCPKVLSAADGGRARIWPIRPPETVKSVWHAGNASPDVLVGKRLVTTRATRRSKDPPPHGQTPRPRKMLLNRYFSTVPSPDAAARIVCLPHAGGGVAAYYRWRSAIPREFELLPVALAGRDARSDERPITRMSPLVAEIADAVSPHLDWPYALVGHSMGAWIALELARALRSRGALPPKLLVVAASRPPHLPNREPPFSSLPDAEFVDELVRRFDGIPHAVRANRELLQWMLPALRADIELVETYRYRDEPPLETDIVALGGTNDPAVTAAELADWQKHTAGQFAVRMVRGGHFFLFESPQPGMSPPVHLIVEQLEQRMADL